MLNIHDDKHNAAKITDLFHLQVLSKQDHWNLFHSKIRHYKKQWNATAIGEVTLQESQKIHRYFFLEYDQFFNYAG